MKPVLRLASAERDALVRVRDHDAKPYVRERAAALLRLADGQAGAAIARSGLRPRDPDTIYAWRERYKQRGLASLYDDRPGQRRTGSFSPSAGARHGDRRAL